MRDCFLNKKVKYVNWGICKWLAGISVLIFMLTNVVGVSYKGVPLVYWFSLIPNLVNRGWVWQFVTYMFVHGSPTHLLLNLYGLFIFGGVYERNFGSIEFLLFFFTTGILGGLISYLIYITTGLGNVALMGMSGAIYALLFTQSVFAPQSRLLLFFFIPVKIPMAMIIFILVETVSQLTGSGASIAHLVHLSSIAVSWFYCVVRFRTSPLKVWRENL